MKRKTINDFAEVKLVPQRTISSKQLETRALTILGSAKGLDSGRRGHRVGHQNKPIRSSGCKRSGDAGTSRNSSLTLIGRLRRSTRWLCRPESRPLAELTISTY